MKRVLLFLFFVLMLAACGKESSSKSEDKTLEQIVAEKGIPVEVEKIVASTFEKELVFIGKVTGFLQTNGYSPISSEIEKINFSVGDWVKKEDVIIEFPKDKPSANLVQATTVYQNLNSTYKRMLALFEEGGISKQDLDNARTAFEVAKANAQAASKMVFVRAPIDGYITNLPVQETNNVMGDDLLFTISNTSKMKSKLFVSDDEVLQIKKGQRAVFSYQNSNFEGFVSDVSISMDEIKKGFAIFTQFENPQGKIPAGVVGEIRVVVYQTSEVIVIPRRLLFTDAKGSYTWTTKENTAKKSYVTVGNTTTQEIEIVDGLAFGDWLITTSSNQLIEGVKLAITKN